MNPHVPCFPPPCHPNVAGVFCRLCLISAYVEREWRVNFRAKVYGYWGLSSQDYGVLYDRCQDRHHSCTLMQWTSELIRHSMAEGAKKGLVRKRLFKSDWLRILRESILLEDAEHSGNWHQGFKPPHVKGWVLEGAPGTKTPTLKRKMAMYISPALLLTSLVFYQSRPIRGCAWRRRTSNNLLSYCVSSSLHTSQLAVFKGGLIAKKTRAPEFFLKKGFVKYRKV